MNHSNLTPSGTSKPFPRWGLGAIVDNNVRTPWVKSHDYFELLDLGTSQHRIGYLDTAEVYGDGELVLGQWLSQNLSARHKYDLKVGSKVSPENIHSEESIIRAARTSLEKLQITELDIYWLHGPDRKTPWKTVFAGLNRVVNEGVAKQIGISNVTSIDIQEILEVCRSENFARPAYVQNSFSLLSFRSQTEVLRLCADHSLHFMAFSPLEGGILSGKYGMEFFPEDSRWTAWKNSRGLSEYWTSKAFLAIENLRKYCTSRNTSMVAMCLAWVHQYPGIGTTLLGPRRKEHLAAIHEAQQLNLSQIELDELERIFSG